MKIKCPNPGCGSENICFGKDHTLYRSWNQEEDRGSPHWTDFDEGSAYEVDDQPISCICYKCNHKWTIEGSVDDYLDG